jgi:cytochrome oxidase assembly protein ShyY1
MRQSSDFASRAKTPASILAVLALIGVCVLFFFLGKWQWDRTQDILEAERAATFAAVSVAEIQQPMNSQDFGRSVSAVGKYIEQDQVRIGSRFSPDSISGDWIVSAFELSSGQRVAVVRGWVPEGSSFSTPESLVTLEGVLHPSESFYDFGGDQSGEVIVIDSQQLSDFWNSALLDGFIVIQSQIPLDSGAPLFVPPTISTADVAFPLQNFFYAIQWWVFALFAVAIYIRWLVFGSKLRA